MISKREILDLATQTGLQPHVVEKDYVIGWLLAGINQAQELKDTWVFKGGTCLKKCYFETYRFSEDLDFTLLDPSHIDEVFLQQAFSGIAAWVYDSSGIEIPADRLIFEIYRNPRGIDACQGRVYYRGPVTPEGKHSVPRVKLDLTAGEVVVEAPVIRPVRHDYSDLPPGGINILSYSYVEVFAEKIRALKERTRPRDLYDVINFFRRPESLELVAEVRAALTRKCEYKGIGFPQLKDVEAQKETCSSGWRDQLSHQLQALPPFESFWSELPGFFSWLEHLERIAVAALPAIPGFSSAESIATLRPGMPQLDRLDRVRFAAMNRLCVELDYRKENGERNHYLIEPYSLRVTADNNVVLYGVKLPDGVIRSFRTDRIISAVVSDRAFVPRYSVEFIPAGSVRLSGGLSTGQSRHLPGGGSSLPNVKAPRKGTSGGALRYIFRCTVCGKQFTRSTFDATLKAHKNKQRLPCYGRHGEYVKTTN